MNGRERGFLLLSSHLGDPDRKTLTIPQLRELAKRMQGREMPKEDRELTCGLEESEGHHHTDSCYEKVLTCGREVHTHSAACYKADLKIESAAVASTGMTSAAAAAAAALCPPASL